MGKLLSVTYLLESILQEIADDTNRGLSHFTVESPPPLPNQSPLDVKGQRGGMPLNGVKMKEFNCNIDAWMAQRLRSSSIESV